MRILFWTEAFWPAIGGVEVLASELLPALAARGHEILVVTDDDLGTLPEHDEFRSIRIRRLGMKAALRSRSLVEIAAMGAKAVALQREFSPQLVHLYYLGATAFFLRRSPARRARPMLVTLHSEWAAAPGTRPTLIAELLADATWVTAVCQSVLTTAVQRVPAITSRSSVLYNAVAEPDEPLRPLPFDPPRVLCVGRLAPEKGLDLALDAFARIASRHPRLRLVLCGDGAERAPLEARAVRLGIGDEVDFTGWISPAGIAAILNTATLLLMPSRSEALPLAGIEAALMARPIVATRAGGLPELIEDGVTGLLADADPTALAGAVSSLLGDRERAIAMGQAGRQRAQRLFAWNHCVDSYLRMYEKLAEEAADAGPS